MFGALLRRSLGDEWPKESMIGATLDFMRGIDTGEAAQSIDIVALLESLPADLQEMGGTGLGRASRAASRMPAAATCAFAIAPRAGSTRAYAAAFRIGRSLGLDRVRRVSSCCRQGAWTP